MIPFGPVNLATAPPFDGVGLMTFFADHAVSGIEQGSARSFARSVRLTGGVAAFEAILDSRQSGVTLRGELANVDDAAELVSRVRQLFDLDADSSAIDAALAEDPALARSVALRPGVRMPGSLDTHESLFRTMIGQQISVAAARTVIGRMAEALSAEAGMFPTAIEIAERGREVLRGPATRVAAILGIARALAAGELEINADLSVEELTARLVALPGVGPWTAGYLAMRVLGDPDILLTTDLVMLQSAAGLGLPATARSLAAYGERWSPWRSYAGLHLWRSR